MPQIHKVKKLPHSSAQLFDLVADVSKYPEFLPWCSGAQLIRRDDKEIIGKLTIQKGALCKSFVTRNRYQYPQWMTIDLVEGPFKSLNGRWEFLDLPDGCQVNYWMSFDVIFFLAPILGSVMDYIANTMVDAFARRANEVYGDHTR